MIRHLEIARGNQAELTEHRFDRLQDIFRNPNAAINAAKKETSRIMWSSTGRGNIYFNKVEGFDSKKPTRTQIKDWGNPTAIVANLTIDKGIQTALMDGIDVLSNGAMDDLLINMAKEGNQANYEFEQIVLTPGKDGKVNCRLVGKVTSITDMNTGKPKANSDDDPNNPLIRISLSFTLEGQLPSPGRPATIKPITDASIEIDINAAKADVIRPCLPKTKSVLVAEQSASVAQQDLLKYAEQIEMDTHRDQIIDDMVKNQIDKYGKGILAVAKGFIDADKNQKKDALKKEFREAILKLKEQNFKTPNELFKKIEELIVQYHLKNLEIQNPKPISADKEKRNYIDKLTDYKTRNDTGSMGWPTDNAFAEMLNTLYDNVNKSLPLTSSTPAAAIQPKQVMSQPS